MSEIEKLIAKLGTTTRSRILEASKIQEIKHPVPSIGMNLALKGGLGVGRQVLLWGNKSSGKSTFCLLMIAQAQREGKTCAWIDAENSFSPSWAEKLGVNNEELILTRSKTITGATNDIKDFMQVGVDIVVVDSITALVPSVYFEDKKSNELKDVEDSKQIGAQARELSIATTMWNYGFNETLLILISQQRNQFGSMHASLIASGGKAIQFFSSTVIKLFSTEADAEQIKGHVNSGDKVFEEQIGRPVNWRIEKNKQGPQNRTGQYDLYYDGDFVGLDKVGEVLDYSEKYGIIEKGGAWYKIYGEQLQGRQKAIKYLRENPDIVDRMEKELYEQFQ